uniref:Uncharacterized protein n=1 Tax=viral metagenome TaxID=1070528 RepID=A0A6C0I4L0_9ZZZZ
METLVYDTFIQKLKSIMYSDILQERYSVRLTPYHLNIMEKLIKSNPQFFRMVIRTNLRNINDNKFITTDMPYIISIVSYLYDVIVSNNNVTVVEDNADTCGTILKIVFSIAIREQLIKTDTTISCDNIINSCVALLKKTVVPNTSLTKMIELVPMKKEVIADSILINVNVDPVESSSEDVAVSSSSLEENVITLEPPENLIMESAPRENVIPSSSSKEDVITSSLSSETMMEAAPPKKMMEASPPVVPLPRKRTSHSWWC